MEAPTPASALIHSSTLVVAGVFLIIRFAVLFEFTLYTNYYLTLLGALTLAFGSITAVFQNDIKKLVAYSTISQIGYLICGCGFCCYEEVLLYLIVHALNKAFLFVLVGYTVHFFNANTDMRQMGAAYLYSFDLLVLLFAVCFNLAGLPYSAGFLGKEFLLFQVLRDDFISFFVRGCWLVSFFFTPIYMFLLVFVVFFGPKKGVTVAYKDLWSFNFYETTTALLKSAKASNRSCWPRTSFRRRLTYRFQLTAFTSRTTVYLLVSFWLFFSFFGEFLVLIVFNYNTLSDSVPSSFFTLLKAHSVFFLKSTNLYLGKIVLFYIFFFTTTALVFLLSLELWSVSRYFRFKATLDLFLLSFLGLLFLFVFTEVPVGIVAAALSAIYGDYTEDMDTCSEKLSEPSGEL